MVIAVSFRRKKLDRLGTISENYTTANSNRLRIFVRRINSHKFQTDSFSRSMRSPSILSRRERNAQNVGSYLLNTCVSHTSKTSGVELSCGPEVVGSLFCVTSVHQRFQIDHNVPSSTAFLKIE